MKKIDYSCIEECTKDDLEFILHCLIEAIKRCTTDKVCENIEKEHQKVIDEKYKEWEE
jgi:hypothetical protein